MVFKDEGDEEFRRALLEDADDKEKKKIALKSS